MIIYWYNVRDLHLQYSWYGRVQRRNDHYLCLMLTILSFYVIPIYLFFEILWALNKSADEHLAELMPIFERLRAQEQIPCAYPLHMGAGGTAFIRGGSRSTPLSPHAPHCHPSAHWVSRLETIGFRSFCLPWIFNNGNLPSTATTK